MSRRAKMSTLPKIDQNRTIHDPITQIEHDILGRQILAQTILERLRSYPIGALGIYGGWGTGKTSLLNLLCELNKNRESEHEQKELHIEIIDAWKYESGEGLLVPVIIRFKKMIGNADLSDAWKVITKRILAATALSVTDALL